MYDFRRKAQLSKAQVGFTLFEMLRAMVVFGTLAAVAIPLYQNFMQKITDRECLSHAQVFADMVSIDQAISNVSKKLPDAVIPGWNNVCDTLVADNNSGIVNWKAKSSDGSGDSGIIVTNAAALIAANPPASGF